MALDKAIRHVIAEMPAEREGWRKAGLQLLLIAGGFALSIWMTVRAHPEQDLPLWPAWIFEALAFVGLAIVVTSLLGIGPFRDRHARRHR